MMQTFPRLLYSDVLQRTIKNTWTSEATILAGQNSQAVIPSLGLDAPASPMAKMYRYEAWGIMHTTGAPTFQWIVRLGTTAANDISGTVVCSSAAATTNSGVATGTPWHLSVNIGVSAPGQGTNHLTLISFGEVVSSGLVNGVASMCLGVAPSLTWTGASWDSLLTYYISLSAVCGTSSGSNELQVFAQRLTELN